MTLDKERAKKYFQNLFLVAIADGKLATEERELLVGVAIRMGLSIRDSATIMRNITQDEFHIPDTEEQQMLHLSDIVKVMMIDKEIHEKEYELCLGYAIKIGQSEAMLQEIIEDSKNQNWYKFKNPYPNH
ncbi:tellurite resistance TerB family protein [Microscilla marina]|uniref:Co-chaperone DjlA N-terminal domain-containing protein n=1 Tax=Microscilla marina ATCC 23134 TaxID=313606 RepID=A1ZDG6_MICM2|nr:hypothetical protein [Microscilla marina]EAY31705.1 hypothetical protein M23134_05211 [Microscilla marina ATCC 23134]